MRRIIVGAVVLAALATGCGGGAPEQHAIRGTFTLTDNSGITKASDGSCVGKGGYDDITPGLRITVSDDSGKTLATGQLEGGQYTPNERYPNIGTCEFVMIVPQQVPKRDFYKVAVGRRGEQTYSYDEMRQKDWMLSFSLG